MNEGSKLSHTPTPWHPAYDRGCELIMAFRNGREAVLAEVGAETDTSYEEDRANAAFIVRAVNSHDALVKALEAVQRLHGYQGEDASGYAAELDKQIKAALSAARLSV